VKNIGSISETLIKNVSNRSFDINISRREKNINKIWLVLKNVSKRKEALIKKV
jgi:hypothetical protein